MKNREDCCTEFTGIKVAEGRVNCLFRIVMSEWSSKLKKGEMLFQLIWMWGCLIRFLEIEGNKRPIFLFEIEEQRRDFYKALHYGISCYSSALIKRCFAKHGLFDECCPASGWELFIRISKSYHFYLC